LPEGDTVTHVFPRAAVLAEADITGFGLTAARQRTLRGLARALADGAVRLDVGCEREHARRLLLEIPGVGPWTASYIALRALGDPDVLPAEDLGLRHAARRLRLAGSARELAAYGERWRPWRSYAAHYLWAADA
jgi:AraC family transcriptional regulator of adaptative response / DNA-3-methyladenine glycosylase II